MDKQRSGQTPFDAWPIMKKFIYVCNVNHYYGRFYVFIIRFKYEQSVNDR